ncbi:glycosyltransferase family 2 protein [Blastomonas aquatica]|uniref:Glycosyl transferase family A n=1 Tax=Blastomonas aquatica TaxID=1510276 RepID=A0ABQ1JFC9_9SPHN|nr:glycosyltransferase [Blastomonas aquatica]GGB65799.1 glycosyl transferase family A [Blastomonas aquatica]
MMSVLTIVRNRAGHLAQLVEGLRRSIQFPAELVVVDMASDPPVEEFDADFPVRVTHLASERLPLAQARNLAARHASSENLLFLDVDCIPMRALTGAIDQALDQNDALICAEVLYLGPDDARGEWVEEDLAGSGKPHPAREFPAHGMRAESNPGLFWSLAFGIRRARFETLGGFDEAYRGYGGEDTDFGFRADAAGLPLLFMGGPGAFHQHHPSPNPPLQHFDDIVRNAQLFRARWGFWPMEGWLQQFEAMGLLRIEPSSLHVLRRPAGS